MYKGIKGAIKLLNHLCNKNGCSSECPVYKECTRDLWESLEEDLTQLDIKLKEVDMPE